MPILWNAHAKRRGTCRLRYPKRFLRYCMVKGEFVVEDIETMKVKMAEMFIGQEGLSREEAHEKAAEILKGLKRWQ